MANFLETSDHLPDHLTLPPDEVELRGEHLAWKQGGERGLKRVPPDLLWEFCLLAETDDPRSFENFASRCGVLEICDHGLPASHNPPGPLHALLGTRPCRPAGWRPPGRGLEPVEVWRRFAKGASALLRIAAALNGDEFGEISDWRDLYGAGTARLLASQRKEPSSRRAQKELEWRYLQNAVNDWLALGAVRTQVVYRRRKLVLEHLVNSSHNLFGAIACELARRVVAPPHNRAVCTECGKTYKVRRGWRVRKDLLNRCGSEVCKRAAARRSAAAYRERKREGAPRLRKPKGVK